MIQPLPPKVNASLVSVPVFSSFLIPVKRYLPFLLYGKFSSHQPESAETSPMSPSIVQPVRSPVSKVPFSTWYSLFGSYSISVFSSNASDEYMKVGRLS